MPSIAKELMFEEVAKQFDESPYAFVSNFDQLPVAEMADLRRSLEKVSTRSLVVKHTFAKKIFADKQYENAEKLLEGSVLVTFGDENPQDISKALVDFAKENEKVVPSGVIFEGQVHEKAFLKQLAKLPSRQELLTQVVVRVNSPISGLVMTLGQVMRGLVTALSAVKDKKAQTA